MTAFWDKVQRGSDDECWLWTASTNGSGYGRHVENHQRHMAHRYAYEVLVGSIPADLVLDHLCRERLCVNPRHLEPVTFAENIRRGRSAPAERQSCPVGHPYDEQNTYLTPRGARQCRECHRLSNRLYARRRAAA